MNEEIPGFGVKNKRTPEEELRLQAEREVYEEEVKEGIGNDNAEFMLRVQKDATKKNLIRAKVDKKVISKNMNPHKVTSKQIVELEKADQKVKAALALTEEAAGNKDDSK